MSAKKAKKLVLADGTNSRFLRSVFSHPKLDDRGNVLVPKRWIRLVDGTTCIVMLYQVWGSTGYGALDTKVLHKWHIKTVLRRAGVR